VATEAFLRKTGARGLRSIVEEALLEVMYEIPSRDDIVRCVVQANVFTQHESPLLFNAHGHTVVLARDLKSAA
jgi:ATP-dependent Clp protease ATP-binding subunit ClpX